MYLHPESVRGTGIRERGSGNVQGGENFPAWKNYERISHSNFRNVNKSFEKKWFLWCFFLRNFEGHYREEKGLGVGYRRGPELQEEDEGIDFVCFVFSLS